MTFRFIDAVQRLVPNFPPKTWEKLYDKCGARLHQGQLRRVFIVLKDEDRVRAGRESGVTSGANALPVAARGGRGRGRGGREHVSGKRALDDPVSATPAKSKRGK